MSRFTEKLVYYRNRAGMKQKTLAERVELDIGHLNRIEKGKRQPPRLKYLQRIIEVLHLKPEEASELLQLAQVETLQGAGFGGFAAPIEVPQRWQKKENKKEEEASAAATSLNEDAQVNQILEKFAELKERFVELQVLIETFIVQRRKEQ
jgi:transcriptional regulator with XRE-family HTH domain